MAIDRDRLLAVFREELEDRGSELERGLLELETQPTAERREQLVRTLFRAAHSLKGAAQSVGDASIARLAFQLEEAFSQLRASPGGPTPGRVAELLAVVDALRQRDAGTDPGGEPSGQGAPRPDGEAPATTAPLRTSEAVPPQRSRVSPSDVDRVVALVGELRLAVEATTEVATAVRDITSLVRTAEGHWPALQVDEPTGRSRHPDPDIERFRADFAHLRDRLREIEHRSTDSQRQIVRSSEDLDRAVQRLGMVQFIDVCAGLQRTVRDVAARYGKHIELEIAAGTIEIDRSLATALRDPLGHLVRNAADHGIEPPDERSARGKPASGRIEVRAEMRQGQVMVTVADDGRGIDTDAVRAVADRRGLTVPAGDDDLIAMLFSSGLSTAPEVGEFSGRGVGLDAVHGAVEAAGGVVTVTTERGAGTEVQLTLPLTLSRIRAVLVRVADHVAALPVTSVKEVRRISSDQMSEIDGRDVALIDEEALPLAHLQMLLGFPAQPPPTDRHRLAAVVTAANGTVAVAVDELVEEREVVVRSLPPRLDGAPGVLAGVMLPGGRCGLLLSPTACVSRALEMPSGLGRAAADERGPVQPHILLAEDSVTTRTLERSILEAAGYRVTAAADGEEAWQLLQREGVDLVVADVDMPKKDGFALCDAIRSSQRLATVPVVLVTSHADAAHRARGVEVGANAYFVKSEFEQGALLDTVARLL